MYASRFLALLLASFVLIAQQVAGGEPPVCLDHYGDPLPKGVRFRLGTVRLRHEGIVHSLAWMPDGKTLASAAWNDMSRLWRIADGKELRRIDGNLAVRRDGRVFAWGGSLPKSGICISDPETGKEVCWLKEAKGVSMARSLDFSPDGKTLATAGDKGHGLRLWDVASGKECYRLPAHEDQINAVAFSPDGSLLTSAGDNCCISLWDMRAMKEPRLLTKGNRRFTAVATTPDGKRLVTSERSGELVLWDARDGQEIRCLEPWDRSVAKLTISPNGKWLTACTASGAFGLWELSTGRRKPTPAHLPATIGCAAFSPDGETVAVGDESDVIHVYATRTGARIRKIPPQIPEGFLGRGGVTALTWSPDGRTLAIHYGNYRITLYDLLHSRKQLALTGSTAPVFSADGRLLAAAEGSNVMRVYETASGQEVQRTTKFRSLILSVAFAPDGRTLAFGGGTSLNLRRHNRRVGIYVDGEPDFSIRLWDIDAGKELQCLAGHEQQVDNLAFSSDSAQLVSQGADSVVLSWDVAALTRRPTERGAVLSATRRAELWTDLANRDAVRGQKAVGQLIRCPDATVSLLAGKLTPAPALPLERIRSLLADLDSDEFARREKAMHELHHLGEDAAVPLRNALKNKPSLEARRRMEALLEVIDGLAMTPEQLRTVRALQALESIGTPETKQILERLASGAAEARLTEEAKAGLRRLSRRAIHPQ